MILSLRQYMHLCDFCPFVEQCLLDVAMWNGVMEHVLCSFTSIHFMGHVEIGTHMICISSCATAHEKMCKLANKIARDSPLVCLKKCSARAIGSWAIASIRSSGGRLCV